MSDAPRSGDDPGTGAEAEAEGAGGGMALARAGLIVSGTYLVARVLGYVRVVVITGTIGDGQELDAFFAAFRIPDLIFQLVAAGTVAAALVPMVAGELGVGRAGHAWRIVSTIATLMTVALAVLSVVAFFAAPWLVALITPGFDGALLERTIELTRLMLLAPVFLALGAVATSALNAHRRFAAAAIAPVVYDLAIIGAAFLLAPSMGTAGLALGVVAGSLGHLLVQVPALSRAGFRLTPSLDLRDAGVAEALRLMVPRALALGVGQVTFIVATSLASGLDPGSVTAFTLAFTVFSIPLSVIGIPLGIVALPTLSRDLARGAIDEFVDLVTRALRMVLFAIGPIVTLGIVLREPATTILFNYGRFSEDGVQLVATTLVFLLLALPAEGLMTILVRAFYANRDTRTPAIAAVVAVGFHVGIGVVAVTVLGWGLAGLAIGIAVGSTLEAVFLVLVLRREIAAFDPSPLVRVGLPVVLASGAAGLVGLGALAVLDGTTAGLAPHVRAIIQLLVAGGLGGIAYLGVASALRLPELGLIMRLMSDTLSRVRPA